MNQWIFFNSSTQRSHLIPLWRKSMKISSSCLSMKKGSYQVTQKKRKVLFEKQADCSIVSFVNAKHEKLLHQQQINERKNILKGYFVGLHFYGSCFSSIMNIFTMIICIIIRFVSSSISGIFPKSVSSAPSSTLSKV